ncbi:hypothetical protein M405DRAFT_847468 [Rhizopogon salebrosus TDB-379]|nr:hypothetical protein M405DRAFT_847468 [Rhizopogon salebrosus TDB-379]
MSPTNDKDNPDPYERTTKPHTTSERTVYHLREGTLPQRTEIGNKKNPDPTAESTTAVAKGTKTKSKVLSASTKMVWKSNDDAVLIATLLKEREEGHQSDSGFKPKSFVTCAEALKGNASTITLNENIPPNESSMQLPAIR